MARLNVIKEQTHHYLDEQLNFMNYVDKLQKIFSLVNILTFLSKTNTISPTTRVKANIAMHFNTKLFNEE